MGTVTFIKSIGNPKTDSYRAIKEQYEKLFIKHEPESIKFMTTSFSKNQMQTIRK